MLCQLAAMSWRLQPTPPPQPQHEQPQIFADHSYLGDHFPKRTTSSGSSSSLPAAVKASRIAAGGGGDTAPTWRVCTDEVDLAIYGQPRLTNDTTNTGPQQQLLFGADGGADALTEEVESSIQEEAGVDRVRRSPGGGDDYPRGAADHGVFRAAAAAAALGGSGTGGFGRVALHLSEGTTQRHVVTADGRPMAAPSAALLGDSGGNVATTHQLPLRGDGSGAENHPLSATSSTSSALSTSAHGTADALSQSSKWGARVAAACRGADRRGGADGGGHHHHRRSHHLHQLGGSHHLHQRGSEEEPPLGGDGDDAMGGVCPVRSHHSSTAVAPRMAGDDRHTKVESTVVVALPSMRSMGLLLPSSSPGDRRASQGSTAPAMMGNNCDALKSVTPRLQHRRPPMGGDHHTLVRGW